MSERPYVLLSCAASIDGYIDDNTDERLLLSNDEDFDRVDEVRASCDAILVGANTIRRDNPRLLVRAQQRREDRVHRGLPETPIKVTFTNRGDLDPQAQFFAAGDTEKIVFCANSGVDKCRDRLGSVATVVDAGDPVDLTAVLAELAARGVRRLMVEGGGTVHTQFLTAGFADELQLVIAPFFVGDPEAPSFVGPGKFPHHPGHRMTVAEVRQIGDVILARYLLTPSTQGSHRHLADNAR
ncbi:dihydrofolate reductase family protein [Actinomadura fulvescens]|uniref:Bacterial bifunctional deaminase-reductase C-terminal domain-containing protein n=1 Tax=Actinomadura fulvescens TaxID=46160 RepID=A0ABP6CIN6_9ACTN